MMTLDAGKKENQDITEYHAGDSLSWQAVLADRETVTSGPGTALDQLEGFPQQYSEQKYKIDKKTYY